MKRFFNCVLRVGVLALLVLHVAGCAFGTRRVGLRYNSSMYSPTIAGSPTVRITGFNDKRADRSLGCVRNGWGMKTARVEPKPGEPAVPEWIREALAEELTRAGCTVVSDPAAQFVIGGDLQRVYVDSYMSLQGEISLALCMKNGNRTALNEIYHAEASKVNWWGSAKEFQQTLDITLQKLMEQSVPDIAGAMSNQHSDMSVAAVTNAVSPVVAEPAATVTPVLALIPAEPVAQNPNSVAAVSPAKPVVDTTAQLKKLKELKELGLLTEEEFEAKRQELVGQL